MSSVSATVKNGEIVTTASQSSLSGAKTESSTGMDKDAFLQLLVAQMKYQDPLEPTSNTEYISQYATFTQVEQLSNMAQAMSLSRASESVGKTVVIAQTNPENGTTTEVQGVVDFVTYSGNQAFLNINGTNYNIDDVKQVLDSSYTEAIEAVEDFQKAIDKLPNLEEITEKEHGETIDAMYDFYMNTMTDKAKAMMNPNYVTALKQYVNRLDDIRGDDYRTFKK